MNALTEFTAVELAESIASRALSCEDVARALLERIAEREPIVHAWAAIEPDAVLAGARRLDAQEPTGILHGVPLGVKDVIDTFDLPTQMGSPIYRGHRPSGDAACVAAPRAAGALIMGKTVTAEFAGVTPGPTTNPRDSRRTPGGSSSGSAAAVADGMVPFALGTQTGGSIHRPASFCGIVGFRPTRDLINRAGVKAAAEALDTVGILARTVSDVDLLLRVLAPRITSAQPQRPERIGLCRTPLWRNAQPETIAAVEGAGRELARAGIEVDEVSLPAACAELGAARAVINDYQRAHAMRDEWQRFRDQLSPALAVTIRNGLMLPSERFTAALAHVAACRAAVIELFDVWDVLLAPCVDGEAPMGLQSTGEHRFQSLWTTLDLPSLSLPTHTGPNGMPVSVQLVAAPFAELALLEIGGWSAEVLDPAPAERVNRMKNALLTLLSHGQLADFYRLGFWRDQTIYDCVRMHAECNSERIALREQRVATRTANFCMPLTPSPTNSLAEAFVRANASRCGFQAGSKSSSRSSRARGTASSAVRRSIATTRLRA